MGTHHKARHEQCLCWHGTVRGGELQDSLWPRCIIFLQSYNPNLSETKQSEMQMKQIWWRLGLKGCLDKSNVQRSGGVALFWEESLMVNLITILDKVIDVLLQEYPSSHMWRITFVYGEPRVEDRHLLRNSWSESSTEMLIHGWWWEILLKPCGNLNIFKDEKGREIDGSILLCFEVLWHAWLLMAFIHPSSINFLGIN